MIERSCSKHIVLLGIGHTNAHIVRMWGMNPIPDTDLTCISDNVVATYSGMLPAVLAGQQPKQAMEIDLVRLCSSVGAKLITTPVTEIDHHRNEVLFDDRPGVPFDALSIGIGSVPAIDGVDIAGESLIKIKPMQTFLSRLERLVSSLNDSRDNRNPLKVVVVGSGVAGIEIMFCIREFLKSRSVDSFDLQLVTSSPKVLPTVGDSMRQKVVAEINSRGHTVHTGCRVTEVSDDKITLADGSTLPADLVIWATGATAPEGLERLGLETTERGFIATQKSLLSTTRERCFAVGDTGTIIDENLPKAGVYAVRQGPILWNNLRRILDGRPLVDYRPQRSFLKLINTGDGSAIGEWKGRAFQGPMMMRLKTRIDARFMKMYQVDDAMMSPGNETMQCRGCGCKLGAEALDLALASIGSGDPIPLQDAAEIGGSGDEMLLASTDFFTSPFKDAYLTGRIAALHSASDIIASGGSVTHALGNVVLAEGDQSTQQKTLADFLTGARREFAAMDGRIVGGHTIVGPRTEVGFTVVGRSQKPVLRKTNLKNGDLVYLTKPLGIGILLAAQMQSQCPAEHYQACVETMLTPLHPYVDVLRACGVSAATDVTGFGLAGHLIEMLRESDVSGIMSLESIPVLGGVEDCCQKGIESTLVPENRRFERSIKVAEDAMRIDHRYKILFDPQTCGGMIFGAPLVSQEEIERQFQVAGLPAPFPVASIHAPRDDGKHLSIEKRPQVSVDELQ